MIVAGRWRDLVYSKKEWGQQMDMNRAERKKDQVNMCDGERERQRQRLHDQVGYCLYSWTQYARSHLYLQTFWLHSQ